MYVHVFSFLYFYSRSIKHVCGCGNKDPFIDHHLAAAALAVLSAAAQGSAALAAAQLYLLRQCQLKRLRQWQRQRQRQQ